MSSRSLIVTHPADMNAMRDFPFQLTIDRAGSNKHAASLSCTALLRTIPGKRDVYDAVWDNRNVIVKVFSRGIGAKRRVAKEWRGLTLLQKRGLSAPAPLFYGRTRDRRWAVVQERIVDSSTVLEVLERGGLTEGNVGLLVRVLRELAIHHGKGVLQKDLHLGNFLLQNDKLFAVDPGQMRFLSHPVSRRRSISQVALLSYPLLEKDRDSIERLCDEYFSARGWQCGESDTTLLYKELVRQRQGGVRNCLKKCIRTSKRYVRIRKGGHVGVFVKSFCLGAEPLDFVGHIDALMDGGQILKKGNTCHLSRVEWNGKDIVVKRYNHKGFLHSLRHTLKRSRARRGWLHAHRLIMLGIPTPRPLAYVEQRRRMLVWRSYFVSEYVAGPNFDDILRQADISESRLAAVRQSIVDLLDKLTLHRITHGDLKHTNILVTEAGPVLIDLDGMRVHRWNWMFKITRHKDIIQLTRNKQTNRRKDDNMSR